MDAVTFQQEALRCERLLYHISYAMLKNNQDCADAVQEALLQAWVHRNTLRSPDAFKPWLTKILVNTCKSILRKSRRASFVELSEALPAAERADYMLLYDALDELPPEMRAATVLYYFEGFSVKEVAGMVGARESTIKSRLLYARRKLRDKLGEEIEAPTKEVRA